MFTFYMFPTRAPYQFLSPCVAWYENVFERTALLLPDGMKMDDQISTCTRCSVGALFFFIVCGSWCCDRTDPAGTGSDGVLQGRLAVAHRCPRQHAPDVSGRTSIVVPHIKCCICKNFVRHSYTGHASIFARTLSVPPLAM